MFFQEISVKDIDTSLVVQRDLDKKKYESINRERSMFPRQALWCEISFKLSHGDAFQ